MRFHASCMITVRCTCSGVRCAASHPFQSLYLSMVRSSVDLPLRHDAIVSNNSSYWGRYSAAEETAHWAVTFDQSSRVLVSSLNEVPQGWSPLSAKLLCAMPTMIASALLSGFLKPSSSSISIGRVRLLCCDRFEVVTS